MFDLHDGTAANATDCVMSTQTITANVVVEVEDMIVIEPIEIRHYYLWDIVFRPVVRVFKTFLLSTPPLRHRAREDGL